MAKFGFRHRFHDFKYFDVRFYFINLEFVINLRSSLQKFVENNQFNINLSYLKQI